jgi:hypothetical protein
MVDQQQRWRRWMWVSASLAAIASLADQPPYCPLATELADRVVVEPEQPDFTRHFVVRSSGGAGVSVTIEASTADASDAPTTLEVWLLNDTPSEHRPDEMRILDARRGVTASTTVSASGRFELGLRALGPRPVSVRFVVHAETDDCSESPFVRIDVE